METIIFKKRRKEFLRRIQETGSGVVILAAATEHERNPGVNHEFRQESNFYYLTGLEQPDAIAVFDPRSRKPYTLFVYERDLKKEVWIGPSVGPEEAVKIYGANKGEVLENLETKIQNLGQRTTILWYHLGSRTDVDAIIHRCLKNLQHKQRSGIQAPDTIRDPLPIIATMRLYKSKEEIAAIQKAVDITAAGFKAAIKTAQVRRREYELRAALEYEFRRRGMARHGYPPIVSSGAGTCVLHNPHDRITIKKDSLVLIDAGAEWDYYSADITRTFPASGRFTKEQRVVYDIVLEAQERAIAMVKPGARFKDIEDKTREFVTKQLLKKKIIVPPRPEPLLSSPFKPPYVPLYVKGERGGLVGWGWFPHRIGHWLGLDVHDVGRYDIPFAPGMVLTIEPGIYLRPSKEITRQYWSIGIRIEDDILVTSKGSKALSHRILKKPDDLERILSRS